MNRRTKLILRNMLFLLSIPGIILAFVFAQNDSGREKCRAVNIQIANPALSFVTREDLTQLLEDRGIVPGVTVVRDIQLSRLEKRIMENPWIKSVNMYISAALSLEVNVEQKNPVLRIQPGDAQQTACYLDEEANPMPLSDRYIPEVPVWSLSRIGHSRHDLQLRREAVKVATYIRSNQFWNAMITQIHLNEHDEFELIPALGNHTILLGDTTDLHNKMDRLQAFYVQGIHTIHWELYNELDVRFRGQVIARNTQVTALPLRPEEILAMKEKAMKEKALKEKNMAQASHNKKQSH